MKRRARISALFILAAFAAAYCQYNDAGLWLSANLEKKVSPKLSVDLTPALRFNENITELDNAFLDGGVGYKLGKRLRVSANYRWAQRRKTDNTYGVRHRYYFDAVYKKKIADIVLSYRLRFQNQYNEPGRRANGLNPVMALRNKLQLKYDLGKLYTPFISGEVWYEMDYREKQFNQFRIVGGIEYELNKLSGITLAYMLQKEFSVKNPVTDYNIYLSYGYSF